MNTRFRTSIQRALAAAIAAAVMASCAWPVNASETTTLSISTSGWRCEIQQRRSLGPNSELGRSLLRRGRAETACHVVANRFEFCEPASLRSSQPSVDADEPQAQRSAGRLCAILECDSAQPESDTQPIALDDAFGRREVTPVSLDRICAEID